MTDSDHLDCPRCGRRTLVLFADDALDQEYVSDEGVCAWCLRDAAVNALYDSRPATYEHIARVRSLVLHCAKDLIDRGHVHDNSKLVSPEVETFDAITPRLKETPYGSPGYKATMDEFRPGIEHHQQNNDHHPEFFGEDGVRGMHLLQLLEMICDWKAASERHATGDVQRSVEMNAERFGYGDDFKRLLLNTVDYLEGL